MMITRVTKTVILSIRTASQSADFCKQVFLCGDNRIKEC